MEKEKKDLERIPLAEQTAVIRPGYPSPAGSGAYPDATSYGYGYGESEDEKVYLRRMWRAIKKRKWMIAVIAIIVTTVVTVEIYRTKSLYQASATIEIGKENRAMVSPGGVIQLDDEEGYYATTAMNTKIRLIQSRPLLEDVVVALKLDQDPQFLDITTQKSIWESLKTISGKVQSPNAEPTPPQAVATNVKVPENAGERSPEEKAKLAPYVDVLASNLSAAQLPDTRMLVVSYTHTNPMLAATIANAISRVFIARSFENKTEKSKDSSEWLNRQTRELEAKVQQAEQALTNYTRANNIFSSDGKSSLAADKLARLYEQATKAETDRMLKQSMYEEVKAGRVAQLPDNFSDPRIVALKNKLGELKVQLSELEVKFGPDNPKVKTVQQQIEAIEQQINEGKSSLEEKLKADYERAVRDETSLKQALERAKSEAVDQNQASIQLNILQTKLNTAKSLYQSFLEKTNQVNIESAEQHNNLRMIDPAIMPTWPVSPNRPRTIAIGFLLSLMVGVGLALFLEYLDNSIKTVEDLQRYTQLPALTVIPSISASRSPLLVGGKKKALTMGGAASQVIANNSRSTIAEAYRVLRTSVLLSNAGNPPKTILVTSARPGEGKTTTSVNTAISLAQLGASVLVIDCDLRKPSAHKALGVEHSKGLSTYLSRDINIDELIQPLPIPNMAILASGAIPPNPAELISSAKMRDMLRTLAERYDHIILDSPPLMNVTDPVILSTMVDGVVLVVHGGKSTRDLVRRARNELATANAKIFGVVLNNVDLKGQGYDDYYYDRYYAADHEKSGTDGA